MAKTSVNGLTVEIMFTANREISDTEEVYIRGLLTAVARQVARSHAFPIVEVTSEIVPL